MSTIASEIDIDLPVRTVYNQWTQFEDFPAFMSGVENVRQLDAAHLKWQIKINGVEREFDAEITDQVPDERIAWKSTSGLEIGGIVVFHRLDTDQTRIRLQIDWEPHGFVERIGSALQMDEARVAMDLRAFKRLIESNGFESGAWRGTISEDSAPEPQLGFGTDPLAGQHVPATPPTAEEVDPVVPIVPIPGAHNSGTSTSTHPGVIPSPGQFRDQENDKTN